jgi:hypothetical protein
MIDVIQPDPFSVSQAHNEIYIPAANTYCENVLCVHSVKRDYAITVDFTKLWPRQLRDWLGIWEQ